jgi:hypothetical protein
MSARTVQQRAMFDQYGRQVVVVQPGDVVVMNGQRHIAIPMQQYNQYNNNNLNNLPQSQGFSNQI